MGDLCVDVVVLCVVGGNGCMRIEILQSPETIDYLVQQAEKSAGKITRTAVTLGLELLDSLVDKIARRVESNINFSSSEKTTSTTSPFMSVQEAADFLRIRPSTVYLWVSENKIPYSRIGSRLLFNRDELERFVQASTHTEKPPRFILKAKFEW
jgi:excisionase family DNA binding protein